MIITKKHALKSLFQFLLRCLLVEPVHPNLSHRLGTGSRLFFGFILEFNGVVFSVVGEVSVDSEVPVVTSSISRCAGTVFRRCSQGQGLRTFVHRDECACVQSVWLCPYVLQKKEKLKIYQKINSKKQYSEKTRKPAFDKIQKLQLR